MSALLSQFLEQEGWNIVIFFKNFKLMKSFRQTCQRSLSLQIRDLTHVSRYQSLTLHRSTDAFKWGWNLVFVLQLNDVPVRASPSMVEALVGKALKCCATHPPGLSFGFSSVIRTDLSQVHQELWLLTSESWMIVQDWKPKPQRIQGHLKAFTPSSRREATQTSLLP